MKLNIKRTVLIGFAFMAISSFWQMYDAVMPKMLTNTFGIEELYTGMIMAADNVVAAFLLPFFGSLSDKCRSRLGRRRPFILFGTLLAVILMLNLPLIANNFSKTGNSSLLISFVVVLGMVLLSMATFRSPAVALMPDATPKPLRSKGNAVINLMGAVGGILYLGAAAVLLPNAAKDSHVNYLPVFIFVSALMLIALFVIMFFVNEPKLAREQAEYEAAHPEEDLSVDEGEKRALPKAVKRSLSFLLFSIAFWFMGYNGVTTWFTKFAEDQWNMGDKTASLCLMVATGGAIISYLPIAALAGKLGRKKTILIGVLTLGSCFALAFIYTLFFHTFSVVLFLLFAIVGFAWAAINVNSLPMVVEMCLGSDVGKFTGLYYTFSMSAQVITPILSGALVGYIGYKWLFLYSAICVAFAFITMSQVRHGDTRIEAKRGLEAFDVED